MFSIASAFFSQCDFTFVRSWIKNLTKIYMVYFYETNQRSDLKLTITGIIKYSSIVT